MRCYSESAHTISPSIVKFTHDCAPCLENNNTPSHPSSDRGHGHTGYCRICQETQRRIPVLQFILLPITRCNCFLWFWVRVQYHYPTRLLSQLDLWVRKQTSIWPELSLDVRPTYSYFSTQRRHAGLVHPVQNSTAHHRIRQHVHVLPSLFLLHRTRNGHVTTQFISTPIAFLYTPSSE